eukprot:CAMPEP_0195153512 /NCGR_PEP_ID=MMETSP0448-20130528/183189_1 /TAXON_ID=66468 /ORGANISM="Heterocapsa triquestra, Strain CCMP 448" /LENGTH=267 /DNA_ID=CAMNT_0040192279 /DNA_START=86 /DNA_END=889 /DNA_ORIENTATION=-
MALLYMPEVMGAAGQLEAGRRGGCGLLLSTEPPRRDGFSAWVRPRYAAAKGSDAQAYEPGSLLARAARPRVPVPMAKLAASEARLDNDDEVSEMSVRGMLDISEVASQCSTGVPESAWKVTAVVAEPFAADKRASQQESRHASDAASEASSECSTADSMPSKPPGLDFQPKDRPAAATLAPPGLGPPGVWAAAAPEPAASASSLPRLGSAGHAVGVCKPCAFIFKGGCQSGTQCTFCHLCSAGAKKQRVKSWKAAKRVEYVAGEAEC